MPLVIDMMTKAVRAKNTSAIGLLKNMRGSPPEIARERRNPLSNIGDSTKAIKKGMVETSNIAMT
jgi:hypothetical protein